MKRKVELLPLTCALLSMAILSALRVGAQEDPTLDASKRRFPEVSAGFRTVRRGPDGTYYVLASPTPSNPSDRPKRATRSKRFDAPKPTPPVVLVFDSQGEKLRQIPAQNGRSELVSPSSLDIDASGRVYIADQGSNAVSIYAADGTLFVRLSIPAPTQIIALPGDQFAVCSANADQLIGVYDLHGALRREFGEPAELSDDPEVNHRLNTGHLAADEAGNLYFAFRYLPEPTVRKYDPTSGYLVDEMTLTTLDLQPMAQSARQEIARLTSGKAVLPHEIISAIGVDPETQELWLALGNLLMHFDNADRKTGSNRIYAIGGARLVPHFILVEKDDLLLGNDPLGIYEFARASNKVHGP